MSNVILINNNSVEFKNNEGKIYVSSREVAHTFEKRHADVLEKIKTALLHVDKEFSERNFPLAEYVDEQGKKRPEYLLTKDGFIFAVMGFTGAKAAKWKIDFINAFNQMEQALRNNKSDFKVPTTMVEALELALEQAKHIEALNTKIENDKHKVEFYDAVADSKDAITIGDAAKVLNMGIGRNRLFQILRNNKILQSNNVPYQEYIDRGYFRVIEQQWTKPDGENCISIKTLVYQNGLDFIRKLITAKAV